ncbi:WXG100 family type VII secretion target [Nocardia sp. NPDC052566]|uniref:WXG100 family type VII secretion target n=1 Tax=Nocardia sp. NPDC052566 TaxID=3364330 RepID=UPI0037CCC21C
MSPTPNDKDLSLDHAALDKAKGVMENDVIEGIRTTAQQLARSVEASAPNWQGPAALAFVGFHARLNAAIVNLNGRLTELSTAMGASNTKVQAQEADSRTLFTNLQTNTV